MEIEKYLSSLLSMSEQMLDLAKKDEWEKVTEIEAQRRPELESFFSSLSPDIAKENSSLLKQSIKKILLIDDEVMAMGVASKNKLFEMIQKNNSSRQAMSEYQQNTKL